MPVGAVLSLVAVETIGLAVFLIACREPERWSVVARFGLAFGLGLIALNLGLFTLSWIGFPPTPALGLAIVAVSAGAAALVRGPQRAARQLVARHAPRPGDRDPGGWLGTAALVVLVGLCAVAGVTSLLEPVVEWDVMAIWALKARVLLHEPVRTATYFQDASKAYSHLDYPLLWPMAMTWTWCCARTADLQTVKVLSPALIVAIASTSLGLLRRVCPRPDALLFATVTVGLPMVLSQSSRLLADAPLAYFALAAFACCHLWLHSGHGDDLRLSGLFSAGMLFTKNEGLALGAILLVSASAFLLVHRRSRALPLAFVWLGGVPLLLTGTWFAFRMGIPRLNEDYGSRFSPAYFLENAARIPKVLLGAPRYFAAFEDWSVFWPVLAVAVVLTAPRWARASASFLVLAVGSILALYGTIYVVSPWDLDALMASTAGRLLLHIAPLCVYLLAACAREAGLVSGPPSPAPIAT